MGLANISGEQPKSQGLTVTENSGAGWFDSLGSFGKNLADVATLDVFDFNKDNTNYDFNPIEYQPITAQQTNPNFNMGSFSSALQSPTIGALKNVATSNPNEFQQWLGTQDAATKSKVGDLMTKQGWTADSINKPLSPTEQMMNKSLELQTNQYNTNMADIANKKNNWWNQNADMFGGVANITQGLGSLASIYTGFKQLGMMEDQLDIAKDQWAETKNELARVKGTRDKLNSTYMA